MNDGRSRKPLLPLCILALLALCSRVDAQCETDDWSLFAATGDVVEVEVWGNTGWVAAQGVIQVDLSTVSSPNLIQRKINENEGLISSDITAMTVDGFGNVWVGTRTAGVSVFNAAGQHIRDISVFDEFVNVWSDLVIAMGALGDTTNSGGAPTDTVIVSSADSYSQQGSPEDGGFVVIEVRRQGSGFFFETAGAPVNNPGVVSDILVERGVAWLATSGQGLWKWEPPNPTEQVLSPLDGVLLSGNVEKVVRAPDFDHGTDVLWVGTAGSLSAGLQRYDGAALDTVHAFNNLRIFDLYHRGNDLWAVTENRFNGRREVYRVDLTAPADTIRVPRVDCYPDTTYTPRDVAVDTAGRMILGTRRVSYAARESGQWNCPPPLGPHSPNIADLTISPSGTLYFGTGRKEPGGVPSGIGTFDLSGWGFITEPPLINRDMTEVVAWPDSTLWFGTTIDRNSGGLNHYFPETGTVRNYHDGQGLPKSQRTQGRNIWALELDAQQNLWICYGQNPGGGLSVIEWSDSTSTRGRVTNYDFAVLGFVGNVLLKDIAIDSQGRIWATNFNDSSQPGQIYVVDPNGTVNVLADDHLTQFTVADVNPEIGTIPSITIDSTDRIWLAGEGALVTGEITEIGGNLIVSWTKENPSGSQLGGRNPLPYTVAHLDWDENIWLGTQQAGLVRVSPDRTLWTWFDDIQGCPLPERSITGLHIDNARRRVYVGTQSQGIAVINLSGSSGGSGDADPAPSPNPWRGTGHIEFKGIPLSETATVRVYTIAGELVWELKDELGPKIWQEGRNTGGQIVESGIYLVRATSTNGAKYEGKLAVVR